LRLVLLRLLAKQRALYDLPRDMNRFRTYVAELKARQDDLAWVLAGMNPMAKDKAPAAYDALLAIGAEDIAEAALRDAEARLAHVAGELKVALVVQDDAQGMWSQEEPTEAKAWQSDATAKHGFAVAAFLSSRAPYTAAQVARQARYAAYFAAHQRAHGAPATLRDVLQLVGRARRFAWDAPALPASEVARARGILAPHLEARASFPECFAALFGDEAARKWGHAPLGLPARAGFEVALADALAGPAPETCL
jgi:hypothetical protein